MNIKRILYVRERLEKVSNILFVFIGSMFRVSMKHVPSSYGACWVHVRSMFVASWKKFVTMITMGSERDNFVVDGNEH